ncbi:hypothetical protein [Microvirga guangxiensis]|uniref:Uncharacterized protein n=1 Tax=Microvirga guangxiensis TaxID=549386 RepID=A0A1G5E9C2_9HYPH|nr:hypothetical protein [Microvirga guangxiensis]SCY23108.1 hypothetical protein SAMN02927923_00913 [Microvirga guangxiensis]
MRLFATFTLLALGLFWSYPFLAPKLEKVARSQIAPVQRGAEPVLVLAPREIRVAPVETTASIDLTENSEDPRR